MRDANPAVATVLVVDADATRAYELGETLGAASEWRVEVTGDPASALERLGEGGVDVLLLDAGFPGALPNALQRAPDVPVLLLVSHGDDATGRAALQVGARDYLLGPPIDPDTARRAVRYALEWSRLQGEVHRRAVIDELTGLHNARGFEQLARHHLSLADRTKEPVALIFVRVEDEGDEASEDPNAAVYQSLVADTATVLAKAVREADVLARIGADAFCILLSGNASGVEALVLSRLVEAVATHNARSGRPHLALSVGAAVYDPEHPTTLDELIRAADSQMQSGSGPLSER